MQLSVRMAEKGAEVLWSLVAWFVWSADFSVEKQGYVTRARFCRIA